MTYKSWFEEHAKKHAAIMAKLEHLSDNEIIDYFDFDNMVKNEPDFCLLYKENKKCHDLEELNCYLCACPNFRFSDKGINRTSTQVLYSRCSINSKQGGQFTHDNGVHQDCSKCDVPHSKAYVKRYFYRDWKAIMQSCEFKFF